MKMKTVTIYLWVYYYGSRSREILNSDLLDTGLTIDPVSHPGRVKGLGKYMYL